MKASTDGGSCDKRIEEVEAKGRAMVGEVATMMTESVQSLEQIEQAVQEQGRVWLCELLGALCEMQDAQYPAEQLPCACGGEAVYQRRRQVTTKTLLGPIQVRRAYYLCADCGRGQAPLDEALGLCAGSISAALDSQLASLGCRMAFDEAAEVLDELTGVAVSANRIRRSTEQLGALITAHEDGLIAAAWDIEQPPPPGPETGPDDLYISMDGTMAHTREAGWKEVKVGAVYTTTVATTAEDQEPVVRTQEPSYRADLASPAHFGRLVWLEAHRRGLEHAQRVVVIGDGAAWIWRQADYHFPEAIQIVDWYHATRYLWAVANDWYGDQTSEAKAWAESCETLLWTGRVDLVIGRMAYRQSKSQAASEACTYFRNNRHRMRYPDYRAAGLQIGSGTVESGCKQIIAARLKQAGMRWRHAAARYVAKARSWLKSDLWADALALRPPPSRSYSRASA